MRLVVHWHVALNAVFVIGAASVVLSLIDFALPEKQKKAIEKHIYRVSENIVDVRMINWLRWWLQTARRAKLVKRLLDIIAALGYIAIPLVVVGVILIVWQGLPRDIFLGCLLLVISIISMGILALLWAWTVSVFRKIYDTFGTEALNLLAACNSALPFVIAYVFVTAAGLIVVVVWFASVYWWIGPVRWDNGDFPWYLRYPNNWVAEFAFVWFLLFIDGAITLVGATVVLSAKLLFGSLQILVWRIVVYSRGPLAAVILLVTAALGIARLMLTK